ncbi:hypothetical protein BCON_0008g00080 [Botryotinia convoluta]|uniref:Uncharacterized protein n=1 Tax=Botryotinia convoluta TaxID=54673 RepID=A0A4Z1IRP1_9HELO|nr:hypothetical protein BCON_0008g00080 [Botryotinia convoluta]
MGREANGDKRGNRGNRGNPKFTTSPHIYPAILSAVTLSVAPTRNWRTASTATQIYRNNIAAQEWSPSDFNSSD